MGYRSLSCGRPAAEQRYILAMLRVFAQLPPERRAGASEAAAGAAGVSPRLLSRLRKKFLEQMPL